MDPPTYPLEKTSFMNGPLDFGLAYSPLNSAKLSYSSEVMLKLVHRCHAANHCCHRAAAAAPLLLPTFS